MGDMYYEDANDAFYDDPVALTQAAINQGQAAVIQAATVEAAQLRSAQQTAIATASMAVDSLRRTNGATFTQHEDRIHKLIAENPHLIPDEAKFDVDVAEKALAAVWRIADSEARAESAKTKQERDTDEFAVIKAAGHQPYWKALST